MKEHMLEAVKRKRAMLEDESDGELAPDGDESKSLGGHAPEMNENQTALGKEGFDHEEHSGAPMNSKDKFFNVKKDTHDSADLNEHRDMAPGSSQLDEKYSTMGVDPHKDVRQQSSHLAKANAMRNEAMKSKTSSIVGHKTAVDMHDPGMGEDVQPESGQMAENSARPGQPEAKFGLKGARGKLEGFLSRMKS